MIEGGKSGDGQRAPQRPDETLEVALAPRRMTQIEGDEAGTPGMNGQSVNLIEQCDSTVYAVLTDNTSDFPVDGYTDFGELFRLDLDPPALTKGSSRAFECPENQGCVCGVHFSNAAVNFFSRYIIYVTIDSTADCCERSEN